MPTRPGSQCESVVTAMYPRVAQNAGEKGCNGTGETRQRWSLGEPRDGNSPVTLAFSARSTVPNPFVFPHYRPFFIPTTKCSGAALPVELAGWGTGSLLCYVTAGSLMVPLLQCHSTSLHRHPPKSWMDPLSSSYLLVHHHSFPFSFLFFLAPSSLEMQQRIVSRSPTLPSNSYVCMALCTYFWSALCPQNMCNKTKVERTSVAPSSAKRRTGKSSVNPRGRL